MLSSFSCENLNMFNNLIILQFFFQLSFMKLHFSMSPSYEAVEAGDPGEGTCRQIDRLSENPRKLQRGAQERQRRGGGGGGEDRRTWGAITPCFPSGNQRLWETLRELHPSERYWRAMRDAAAHRPGTREKRLHGNYSRSLNNML